MTSALRVVYSGIQPTGVPQLGNLLGSIKNWVELQKQEGQQLIGVVDLHALTVPREAARLRRETLEMAASLIACGIDPQRTILYRQSRVAEHSQLNWALGTITPVGWLNRMTQWKSKLQQMSPAKVDDTKLNVHSAGAQNLLTGLFTYPVLMASDILLFKATHVPVGEDQVQHLEFARDLGEHFNKTYGPTFPLPTPLLTPTKRVMSLRDPARKMSKSDPNDMSRINLNDSDKDLALKIRKATTDSLPGVEFDPVRRPAVSNLVGIYAALSGVDPREAARGMEGWNNGRLKEGLTEALLGTIAPIRSEMGRLLEDKGHLESVLTANEDKARELASRNWHQVAERIGLR